MRPTVQEKNSGGGTSALLQIRLGGGLNPQNLNKKMMGMLKRRGKGSFPPRTKRKTGEKSSVQKRNPLRGET